MVLIFWMVTPLQSSCLGTGPVLMNNTVSMSAPSVLMDPLTQATEMDQSVMNSGYAITWLERPYPAFTTPDYALMPFQPAEPVEGNIANFTGTTKKYWTDLKCWPAEVELTYSAPSMYLNAAGTYNFINGMGCNASKIVARSLGSEHQMLYIPYQDSAWGEVALSWTCSDKAFNQFLATWLHFDNSTNSSDVSAVFCETSYYKQNVSATVQLPAFVPVDNSITPLSPPEPLQVTEFNSSAFEYLVGNGMTSVFADKDYPFTHLLDLNTHLEGFGLPYPFSPMLGIMTGLQNYTIEAYQNMTLLGDSYRMAHRLMFSVAFHAMLVNSTASDLTDGNVFVVKYGIIVSRVFTALVEGGLALVTILTMVLLWVCHGSPTLLSSDPASLGSLIALIQKSPHLLRKFNGKGNLTADQLKEQLGDCRFKLICQCQDAPGPTRLELLEASCQTEARPSDESSGRSGSDQTGHYLPIKPWALRRVVGLVFAVCLCAAVAVFSYLWHQNAVLGGKYRSSIEGRAGV